MKVMHKYVQMKLLAVLLVCALMSGILPHQDASAQQNVSSPAGYGLSNPVVDSNGVTTWDCIYFGSYWQNNTTEKQKIKWRVLSVDGDDVFLLSDRNLSWQVYKNLSDKTGVTWETSTVRSWLNGYGAEDNICGQDYTDDNFLDDAFDAFEQAAIPDTLVINTYDTSAYPSNNNTVDKVYLLSVPEIMKESYGFESTWNKSKKRVAKNTDYINSSESNGSWWLRTIGMTSSLGDRACYVDGEGRLWKVDEDASVSSLGHVVRPALHLNLSARDGASNLVWSYAGKITSNGEEIEAELPTPVVPTESPVPEETTAPTPVETPQASTPVETPQSPTQAPTPDETATVPQQTPSSSLAGYGLSNPVVDSNGVTTWDCIYFGSYWQNDTTEKQKIKWRVLSVEGDDVFLLSDRNLSQQVYNNLSDKTGVTWETSTVRSWLNGYGAEDNICGQDYTDDNFLDDAFDDFEQAAIPDTLVINTYDTSAYPSNNNTVDKVYLLSVPEIMKESYGFESTWNKSKKRVAKNTDYINSSESNGEWWLRTIGMTSSLGDTACYLDGEGRLWRVTEDASVSVLSHVVRPALHLNLSARDGASNLVWSYAGKITSNGKEIEAELPTPVVPTESPVPEETTAPTPVETTQAPTTQTPATQAPPVVTSQSPTPEVTTQTPATQIPTPVVTPQSPTPETMTQAPTTQTPATQAPPVVTPQSPTPETMTQAPTTQTPATQAPPVVTPQSPTPEATATVSPQTPSASPSQSSVPSPGPVKVSSITVSGKITKLAKGKKAKLTPNVEPINATNKNVVWSSSNPKVAVVDSNGTVTAKAAGKAVITATAVDGSGVSGSYKIEVVKHAIKKIIIKAKKSVAAGKKVKVKATIKTTGKNVNKTLEWTTSNQKYATVTSRGVVTTKKAGKGKTVTITAMAMDGSGKKDTVKIKIK